MEMLLMPDDDSHWHISKSITISTLVSVSLLFISQVYVYGKQSEKIGNLERSIVGSSVNAIPKTTVVEMFHSRDIQIKTLTKQIQDVQADVKENNQLLREILVSLPKE
jgi:hypothetical protein